MLVGAPEAFHDDVVRPTSLAVQADADALFLQALLELIGCVLRPLVGVEYLRLPAAGKRHLQGFHAEVCRHPFPQAPPQHAAACPVHDDAQVEVLLPYLQVGDVTRPNLIHLLDFPASEKVGVLGRILAAPGHAGARVAVDGTQAQPFAGCPDALAAGLDAVLL